VSLALPLETPEFTKSLQATFDKIPLESLGNLDKGKFLLARALVHFNLRQNENGLKDAREGLQLLDELGATDRTFVRLQTGLGIIACSSGLYSEALHRIEAAHSVARRLDNGRLIAHTACSLALCHYRLGRADESLRWAMVACQREETAPPGSYDRLHPVARQSFANLALGRIEEARKGLGQILLLRQTTSFPWVQEAAGLFEADLRWLFGDRLRALRIIATIWEQRKVSLSVAFEGPFARWITLFLIHEMRYEEAAQFLDSAVGRLTRLDSIDRAEILCSRFHLNRVTGNDSANSRNAAADSLNNLPVACRNQLGQLGLLLPD